MVLVRDWEQKSEPLGEHPTLLVPLGDSRFAEEALFAAGALTTTIRERIVLMKRRHSPSLP